MDFTNLLIIYSTDSFPGLWEVPMIDYIDLKGKPCNMIDGCSAPAQAVLDTVRSASWEKK